MKLRFTKMQGAGNDFVVLDGTRAPLALTPGQVQRLGDRRFGVGADQILLIERSSTPGVDFRYRIYNNTGDEVEHCGEVEMRVVVQHDAPTAEQRPPVHPLPAGVHERAQRQRDELVATAVITDEIGREALHAVRARMPGDLLRRRDRWTAGVP